MFDDPEVSFLAVESSSSIELISRTIVAPSIPAPCTLQSTIISMKCDNAGDDESLPMQE